VDRVDWCGLSLGAMVGMYLAAEHPERMGRLVLCCTSAHFPDPTVWHDRIAVSAGVPGARLATIESADEVNSLLVGHLARSTGRP
jgi:pimeloyl-ACP methyl ester carboxylesterase